MKIVGGCLSCEGIFELEKTEVVICPTCNVRQSPILFLRDLFKIMWLIENSDPKDVDAGKKASIYGVFSKIQREIVG